MGSTHPLTPNDSSAEIQDDGGHAHPPSGKKGKKGAATENIRCMMYIGGCSARGYMRENMMYIGGSSARGYMRENMMYIGGSSARGYTRENMR